MSNPYNIRDKMIFFCIKNPSDGSERRKLFSLLGTLAVLYATKDPVITQNIVMLRYYLVNEVSVNSCLGSIGQLTLSLAQQDDIRVLLDFILS